MAPDLLARCARVWLLDTAAARARGLHRDWHSLLDPEELGRATRLRRPRERERFVLGHGLLRLALSHHTGVAPEAWRFARDPHGRPWIAEPQHPGLFFSASRCPGLVGVLLCDQPCCGLDVERVGRTKDPTGVARGHFDPGEQARLAATPTRHRDSFFARHWALKEAWAKAVGRGLDLPVHRVSFDVGPHLDVHVTMPPPLGDPAAWSFHLHQPGPDHMLAVALGQRTKRQVVVGAWAG